MSTTLLLKGMLRLYSAATILHLHDNTISLTDQGEIFTTEIYNVDQLFLMLHLYRQKDYPALKHQFKRYRAQMFADSSKPHNTQPVTLNNLDWTIATRGYTLKITGNTIVLCDNASTLLNTEQTPTVAAIHRSLFLFSIGQFDQIVFGFSPAFNN